jgi:predicted Rossmann-fold nucleotide-binding protein
MVQRCPSEVSWGTQVQGRRVNAKRRLIVGVIGGDDNMRRGEKLGREIARRGWILLTGGQVLERAVVAATGAVKDAAMLGADAAESEGNGAVAARLAGILPSKTVQWRRSSARRLFLETGLSHNVRNVITGRTPDIVVAFGGSQGTLAEVAFAKAAGREVVFYVGLERLRRNFEKYFGRRGSARIDRQTYFEEPLRTYPEGVGAAGTVASLISQLGHALAQGIEADCTAVALADRIEGAARPIGQSGFPGLPGDSESKSRFEALMENLSD